MLSNTPSPASKLIQIHMSKPRILSSPTYRLGAPTKDPGGERRVSFCVRLHPQTIERINAMRARAGVSQGICIDNMVFDAWEKIPLVT